MKIAVLCSSSGTNLQAIIDSVNKGRIPAEIVLVVSDNKYAFALKRARKAGIESLVVDRKEFLSRADFDRKIIRNLDKKGVDLVVLAGFMRILSPYFIRRYRNKIINIHPALLPSFKGTHGIRDALEYGVKVTGVTVHFVDEKLDHGAIILQRAIEVKEKDTEATLLARLHKEEHRVYPEAIKLFIERKLKITGRKVKLV